MTAEGSVDRRKFSRRRIRLPIQILSEENVRWSGWTVDVSPQGLLWEASTPFAARVGDLVRVRLGPAGKPPHAVYEVGSARVIQLRLTDPPRIGLELLGGPCAIFVAPELVGSSPAMQEVKRFLSEIAACPLNVLITGETGTGKSLLARVIHSLSLAGGQPFVGLNCPSIPATLFESELFGHEKGAFTGADGAVPGYLRLAGEGTLLLDEVSEIPVGLQAKLLRAIENKEFVPVGGSKVLSVRARIIATTSTNVKEAMKQGRLRPDLFYRLSELAIRMPSLGERRGDIPLLAEHFLGEYCLQFGKPYHALSAKELRQLCGYPWPGNVRELAALMRRTAVHGRFHLPGSDALPGGVQPAHAEGGAPVPARDLKSIKEDICAEAERAAIVAALKACGSNRTRAASALKVSYRTLLRKIAKYKIAM